MTTPPLNTALPVLKNTTPAPTKDALTKTPTPIAGWKIYRNDVYGYQINYPSNFGLVYWPNRNEERKVLLGPSNVISRANFNTNGVIGIIASGLYGFDFYLTPEHDSSKTVKEFNLRELFNQRSNSATDREVKELSINGLVGFQVNTIWTTTFGGKKIKDIDAEVVLGNSWEDKTYFTISEKFGEFSNEEEKLKLQPSIDIFNRIVSTFIFIPYSRGSILGKVKTNKDCVADTSSNNSCIMLSDAFLTERKIVAYNDKNVIIAESGIDFDGDFVFLLRPGPYTLKFSATQYTRYSSGDQATQIEIKAGVDPVKVTDGATTNVTIYSNLPFSQI